MNAIRSFFKQIFASEEKPRGKLREGKERGNIKRIGGNDGPIPPRPPAPPPPPKRNAGVNINIIVMR